MKLKIEKHLLIADVDEMHLALRSEARRISRQSIRPHDHPLIP